VGASAQLSAVTRDANNNVLTGRVISWTSGNTGIATVSVSGLVTAVAAGSVSITASSEGQTGSAAFTVNASAPIPVATVSVSPGSSTLQVAAAVQLSATTRDANSNVLTGRIVTWSSSNPGVSTVSASGLVTALAAGSATITALSETKTGNAAITVSAAPVPVATVSVSPSTASLLVGGTQQLSAVTRDANNNVLTGRVVTWSSSNPAVSTVSASGLVNALAAGGATITALSETKIGTSVITATAPPPPPPGGGSGWRGNEPAGMTPINDRPFNTKTEDPAWDPYGSDAFTIVTDATAPHSPSNVMRATYPAGYGPGGAPAFTTLPHTAFAKIYISVAVKLSSNWVGNGSGVNKYGYEWVNTPHPSFFFGAHGVGSGPLQPMAFTQDLLNLNGGFFFTPNLVPTAQIIRGQWYTYEYFVQGNTSGNADGKIDWYLDGVHVGSASGIQWTSGATTFTTFQFYPIWGGGNTSPAITQTQTMDWDHVYISGKN
jgi:uncharacterized protein YjdB